jgi:hypothetical protein
MWKVAEVFKHGLPEDVLKENQRLNRNSLPSVQGMTGTPGAGQPA